MAVKQISALLLAALVGSLSLPSFASANPGEELSLNDLRAMDPELEGDLKEAGLETVAESSILVVQDDEGEDPLFQVRGLPGGRLTPRDHLVLSVLYSRAYMQGVGLSYVIQNRNRNKLSWSFDVQYTNSEGLEGLMVGINKHIGRKGIYIGGNGQLARFKVDLVEGKPEITIPFVGGHAGFAHEWGRAQRVRTTLQLGLEATQYEGRNLIMPDARIGVGIRIGGGKR